MLGRLRRPAEFEAVLATSAKVRGAHFAAHHLPGQPAALARPKRRTTELSTDAPDHCPQAVDDFELPAQQSWWFGVVVPKRHARKATTRNLLRRQMREALQRHHASLACGMWLLRLCRPFDSQRFRSAAPARLRDAARAELEGLLKRAAT